MGQHMPHMLSDRTKTQVQAADEARSCITTSLDMWISIILQNCQSFIAHSACAHCWKFRLATWGQYRGASTLAAATFTLMVALITGWGKLSWNAWTMELAHTHLKIQTFNLICTSKSNWKSDTREEPTFEGFEQTQHNKVKLFEHFVLISAILHQPVKQIGTFNCWLIYHSQAATVPQHQVQETS